MVTRSRIIRILAVVAVLLPAGSGIAVAGGANCEQTAKHESSDDVYVVEGDVQHPKKTGGPAPDYPKSGKNERIEGVVVTRLLIEKDGAVSDAEVVQPLRDDFDAVTLEAVRQWTFEPATLDGEPVRVHYNITVNYRLDKDGDETAGEET